MASSELPRKPAAIPAPAGDVAATPTRTHPAAPPTPIQPPSLAASDSLPTTPSLPWSAPVTPYSPAFMFDPPTPQLRRATAFDGDGDSSESDSRDESTGPADSLAASTPSSPATSATSLADTFSPPLFDAVLRRHDSLLSPLRVSHRSDQVIVGGGVYRHLEVYDDDRHSLYRSLSVYTRGTNTRLDWTVYNAAAFAHTRAIDLHGELPLNLLAHLTSRIPNLETVRLFPDAAGRCIDKCPAAAQNLVIIGEPRMPRTDPGGECIAMAAPLHRVVVHFHSFNDTNSLWYHQLLYPHGTHEVVIVFTGWKRPHTPRVPSGSRWHTHRELQPACERFQNLRYAIEHILTKRVFNAQGECDNGIKCTVIDLDTVDPQWFGLPRDVSLAHCLYDEVRAGLESGRWASIAEEALSLLAFKSDAQWREELLAGQEY